MKKTSIFVMVAMAAASLSAATVDSVSFTQDWPWSTDIKITYLLSGVTAPVDVAIEAFDGETALPMATQNALKGDICGVTGNGLHTVTLDPKKAFGSSRKAFSDFKVRVTASDSPANADEVLYKIFEIKTGSCTDVTRKDLVNGKYGDYETDYSKISPGFTTSLSDVLIWTGVTNDIAYKTTHLVMRKINAANKIWQAGDPEGTSVGNAAAQTLCHIKLSYDYYIAVFEMTVAQHARCLDSSSASVSALSRNAVDITSCYGHPNTGDSSYWTRIGNEKLCFPTNSYLRDVGKNTTAGNLWGRTTNAGHLYEFTLPTRAEWEFAAHGGNDGVLYSGEAQTLENVNKLAWHYGNSGGARQEVGTKLPNAYGLYDMLGNLIERVCSVGHYSAAGVTGSGTEADPYVDPICRRNTIWQPSSGTHTDPNVMGGGAYESTNGKWQDCRPEPAVAWNEWYSTHDRLGYRLVIPARADGQWADHPAQ